MSGVIGLDRRIHKEWLDATLDRLVLGDDPVKLRSFLDELLKEDHPGKSSRSKSVGIVLRIWGKIPKALDDLRTKALALLPQITTQERTWLHWGMTAIAYPFFRDAAEIIGRLLALQEDFTLVQAQGRLKQDWGDRTITKRAAGQVIGMMQDWDIVQAGKTTGHFYVKKKTSTASKELELWFLEALLRGNSATEIEAQQLLRMPAAFPFNITVGLADIRECDRFEVHREGLDTNMVSISTKKPKAETVPKDQEGLALFDVDVKEPEVVESAPVDEIPVPTSTNGKMVPTSPTEAMLRQYWEMVGGTLVRNVRLTNDGCCADAVILPNGEKSELTFDEGIVARFKDQHILVVQVGAGRLGMELMGRAVFGGALAKRLKPRSITSVALCQDDAPELNSMLVSFPHVQVVVQK